MYIYVWLDGEAVGYSDSYMGATEEMSIFKPFGYLYLCEKDAAGDVQWLRCKAWDESGVDTAEEATALLKEYLAAVAGVYEAIPIVSEERPERPETTAGEWTREKVIEVIRDEMLRRGVVEEDLTKALRFAVMWTENMGLKVELGRQWLVILPSTTEKEIRGIVGLYAWDVRQGWKAGDTKTLPKTRQLQDELKDYVSTAEGAALLGYGQEYVNLLCRQGKLPGAKKIGTSWMIPRKAIEGYVPGPQGFAAHPEKNPRKKKEDGEKMP